VKPRVFADERGYFFESFNQKTFEDITGFKSKFVQDNESYSSRGVLRGLHFQKGEYAQAKLVRVIKGRVLDVAVDLRKDSPTFKQYVSVELSGENKIQFLVPAGFAHGFIVLSETALFSYKCDNFYNNPELNIDWGLEESKIKVSDKDKMLPTLKNVRL
jgi:dTDP-4-dehydrorhamnose 3,5-epimerase